MESQSTGPETSQRRRVLWLSHFLPWPPKGGLLQRSYYLMRGVGRRHDLHVIAFRQRAHQPDAPKQMEAISALSEFSTVRTVLDLPEDRMLGGRKWLALRSLLPGPPYSIRWGTCPEYGEAVRTAMQTVRPEVVHFDTISLIPYLDLINGVPAVLTHHNIESQMLFRRAKHEANLAKRAYFWQEAKRLAAVETRLAPRFAAHLVCAELDGKRLLATVGQVTTRVVPNGVDLDYFQPAPEASSVQPETLVFVGGLSWYPNVNAIRFFLREAWPGLSTRFPGVQLKVIGQNPPSDLIAISVRDSRIDFPGFIDDIRPIVHDSSVYICPIRDGGGTKLKMLDAMAMGKAIVAHPVACEGLDILDGKHVLMAVTGPEFIESIGRLFEDPNLRENLGRAAREHVESRFSFETIGNYLADLLGNIAMGVSPTDGFSS